MAEIIKHPTIMKKLKAVLKESFRLHPPLPLLVSRSARRNVKVMGYDIENGTRVLINAYAIGRDPTLWAEPDEFRPERFLNSSVDFKGQDFELIPFGAGRRICPGVSFAISVIELVLANLMLHFDWVLPEEVKGADLDMTELAGVTTHRESPLLAVAIQHSP